MILSSLGSVVFELGRRNPARSFPSSMVSSSCSESSPSLCGELCSLNDVLPSSPPRRFDVRSLISIISRSSSPLAVLAETSLSVSSLAALLMPWDWLPLGYTSLPSIILVPGGRPLRLPTYPKSRSSTTASASSTSTTFPSTTRVPAGRPRWWEMTSSFAAEKSPRQTLRTLRHRARVFFVLIGSYGPTSRPLDVAIARP